MHGNESLPSPFLQVSGTADPYWLLLQQHIEGAEGACAAQQAQQAPQVPGESATWQFEAAFAPDLLARHAGVMPAFVMSGARRAFPTSVFGVAAMGSAAQRRQKPC